VAQLRKGRYLDWTLGKVAFPGAQNLIDIALASHFVLEVRLAQVFLKAINWVCFRLLKTLEYPVTSLLVLAFWPAPQKLVRSKWESPGRVRPGGTHGKAKERRRGRAIAP